MFSFSQNFLLSISASEVSVVFVCHNQRPCVHVVDDVVFMMHTATFGRLSPASPVRGYQRAFSRAPIIQHHVPRGQAGRPILTLAGVSWLLS